LKEVKSKPISVEVFSDDFSRDAPASAQDARLALSSNSFIASTTNPPPPFLKFFDQSGLARNRSTQAKHCEVQGHIAILLE
jgi:hypothetical protein